MTSTPDIALVTELCVGIARRLTDILSPTADDAPEGHLYHAYTSDFEQGCWVLWTMGLATAVDGKGSVAPDDTSSFPPCFKLMKEAAMRQAFAEGLTGKSHPLPLLLETFIALACDYGMDASERLPTDRAPFTPAPVNAVVAVALAEHGYLSRDGHTFAWTDQIAPIMNAAHFWDDAGQSLSGISKTQVEVEASHALDTLPADISLTNELALTDHLRHRWSGRDWSHDGPPRHDLGHLIPLARRILSKADSRPFDRTARPS